MNKYHGQFIALPADYITWLIHGRHHSVVLIHMILRDIHTKSWYGHDGVLDDMILLFFPVWFQMYISIV